MLYPRFFSKLIGLNPVQGVLAMLNQGYAYSWSDAGEPSRRTLNYGWNFLALEKGERTFIEIPREIELLRRDVFEALAPQIAGAKSVEAYDNVIVSIYDKGEAIIPHIDRDGKHESAHGLDYNFGETILGVVLEADESGRLRFIRHDAEGKPPLSARAELELDERKGLAFLFQNEFRHFPYFHAVSPVSSRRISVTFRSTHF